MMAQGLNSVAELAWSQVRGCMQDKTGPVTGAGVCRTGVWPRSSRG